MPQYKLGFGEDAFDEVATLIDNNSGAVTSSNFPQGEEQFEITVEVDEERAAPFELEADLLPPTVSCDVKETE